MSAQRTTIPPRHMIDTSRSVINGQPPSHLPNGPAAAASSTLPTAAPHSLSSEPVAAQSHSRVFFRDPQAEAKQVERRRVHLWLTASKLEVVRGSFAECRDAVEKALDEYTAMKERINPSALLVVLLRFGGVAQYRKETRQFNEGLKECLRIMVSFRMACMEARGSVHDMIYNVDVVYQNLVAQVDRYNAKFVNNHRFHVLWCIITCLPEGLRFFSGGDGCLFVSFFTNHRYKSINLWIRIVLRLALLPILRTKTKRLDLNNQETANVAYSIKPPCFLWIFINVELTISDAPLILPGLLLPNMGEPDFINLRLGQSAVVLTYYQPEIFLHISFEFAAKFMGKVPVESFQPMEFKPLVWQALHFPAPPLEFPMNKITFQNWVISGSWLCQTLSNLGSLGAHSTFRNEGRKPISYNTVEYYGRHLRRFSRLRSSTNPGPAKLSWVGEYSVERKTGRLIASATIYSAFTHPPPRTSPSTNGLTVSRLHPSGHIANGLESTLYLPPRWQSAASDDLYPGPP
ncbi:hypothetical protein BDN72DRAFT_865194 [Pluteus cervinus]|uniref:Uncharacterized protein n=1 Tax=Pluteus cervinus TaxID=181527 RepID=A0ACD3A164_9AGAR|nr:hypothetical protein BDN72DRAFT_865194 [Pluteus cervinus]